MRIEKSDVALAMLAGADAIENNRNLKTRFLSGIRTGTKKV